MVQTGRQVYPFAPQGRAEAMRRVGRVAAIAALSAAVFMLVYFFVLYVASE